MNIERILEDISEGVVALAALAFVLLMAPIWGPAWIIGRALRAFAKGGDA